MESISAFTIKKPGNLSPMASEFWDSVAQNPDVRHSPTEMIVLAIGCKWLTQIENRITELNSVPAGIATDKFLAIAAKFGFTPADREKAGVAAVKPKPAPRRKRSADELTPEAVTAQLQAASLIPAPLPAPQPTQLPTLSGLNSGFKPIGLPQRA